MSTGSCECAISLSFLGGWWNGIWIRRGRAREGVLDLKARIWAVVGVIRVTEKRTARPQSRNAGNE
jgi:hypothetical protein